MGFEMKKLMAVLVALTLSSTASAALKTMSDNYVGAKLNSDGTWNSSQTDVLPNGAAAYDLQSIAYDYDKATRQMTVVVDRGAFRPNTSATPGIDNGDLFLHFNLGSGINVDLADSLKDRSDLSVSNKGVDWNDGFGFVFDTSSKQIYGGTFGIEYAGPGNYRNTSAPGGAGNGWSGDSGRNGQEVGYKSGGKLISSAATDNLLGFSENGGRLTYTFDMSRLSSAVGINNLDSQLRSGSLDLSARWTMSCANDVLQSRFTIPEPSMLALLGLGLIGVAGMRRRA